MSDDIALLMEFRVICEQSGVKLTMIGSDSLPLQVAIKVLVTVVLLLYVPVVCTPD